LRRRLLLWVAAAGLACGVPGPGSVVESAGAGSGELEGSGESSDSETPRFDVAEGDDPGPCSKVDVLFVIDDSASMVAEQQALVAAFPGFVAAIETGLASVASFHVGVVTTDAYVHNEPGCRSLGDLVSRTGQGSTQNDCGTFASGRRFLDENEPDLAAAFACIAGVGTDGTPGEAQAGAILGALDPARAAPGGCNEGFRRDDALLVVVLVTDEDDAASCYPAGCVGGTPGTPADWFADIVGRAGGREENVILLAVVGPPGAYWDCGVEDAPRLVELTDHFTHGVVGDICSPNLAGQFVAAMTAIAEGCLGLRPEG
jgi:hypothetical protein